MFHLQGAERPWPDRQWALCIFDDLIEHTGPVSVQELCTHYVFHVPALCLVIAYLHNLLQRYKTAIHHITMYNLKNIHIFNISSKKLKSSRIAKIMISCANNWSDTHIHIPTNFLVKHNFMVCNREQQIIATKYKCVW